MLNKNKMSICFEKLKVYSDPGDTLSIQNEHNVLEVIPVKDLNDMQKHDLDNPYEYGVTNIFVLLFFVLTI